MADEPATQPQLPAAAAAAAVRGSKIDAIRETRAATGLGLYEAKQLVDEYIAANPLLKEQFEQRETRMKRRVFHWVLVVDLLIFVAIVWWIFGG
jgi:ribosomal protein L7/L12